MCALAQSLAVPPPKPANREVGGWAQDQSGNELAVPLGTWPKEGWARRKLRLCPTNTGFIVGGGEWVSVFLQAPEHSSWHALLLQSHLWGKRGKARSLSSSPEGGPTPPPPPLCQPLTIGLKIHLVLVLILA